MLEWEKLNYSIQRKTIFGWNDIGYWAGCYAGDVWNKYFEYNKEELLNRVLESYYEKPMSAVKIIEYPQLRIY
jgi:hypothetical protein